MSESTIPKPPRFLGADLEDSIVNI